MLAGRPTRTISFTIPRWKRKPLKSGFSRFFPPSTSKAPAAARRALDKTVAQAAPAKPQLKVKMKMGSKMALRMADAALKIMGVMVSPWRSEERRVGKEG